MHTTALTVRQRRYVTATTSREGRSPLVWQTTYTHVDTRNDVARRHPSRLFDFNALATVTGHSSSCNSLRPFAIRKILASIFIAFPRKNASATTTANIVLGTWYIPVYIYTYMTRGERATVVVQLCLRVRVPLLLHTDVSWWESPTHTYYTSYEYHTSAVLAHDEIFLLIHKGGWVTARLGLISINNCHRFRTRA